MEQPAAELPTAMWDGVSLSEATVAKQFVTHFEERVYSVSVQKFGPLRQTKRAFRGTTLLAGAVLARRRTVLRFKAG
jgi:hypothetical protein